MNIAELSKRDLVALASRNEVSTFRLGFDMAGTGIVLKMRFKSRLMVTYRLEAEDVLRFSESLLADADRLGWKAEEPREELMLTDADWDAHRALKSAAIARVDAFDDAVVIAVFLGGDLYQGFRLRPGFARAIAGEVLHGRNTGALHDLRSQGPTTDTRQ